MTTYYSDPFPLQLTRAELRSARRHAKKMATMFPSKPAPVAIVPNTNPYRRARWEICYCDHGEPVDAIEIIQPGPVQLALGDLERAGSPEQLDLDNLDPIGKNGAA